MARIFRGFPLRPFSQWLPGTSLTHKSIFRVCLIQTSQCKLKWREDDRKPATDTRKNLTKSFQYRGPNSLQLGSKQISRDAKLDASRRFVASFETHVSSRSQTLYFDSFLLICTSFVVRTRGIVCVVYLLFRLANYKDSCKRCVLALTDKHNKAKFPVSAASETSQHTK